MSPSHVGIALVMCHAVYGHLLHLVMITVVEVGIRVQIAIAHAGCPLLMCIAQAHVHTFGLGCLQVLILSGALQLILRLILRRCRIVGHIHQRDHVFHIIYIPCHVQHEALPAVLSAYRVIV